MSPVERVLAEAEHDTHDLLPYADRLAALPEGRIYLRLLEETAHDALLYAHAHCDGV